MAQALINYIEIRPNQDGQPRAHLAGTRVRVQDIYFDSEVHGMCPDRIAAGYPHLTLAQVHAALAYYFDHQEEIQNEIRQDQDFVAKVKAVLGPGPLAIKLHDADASGDSVSS